MIKVEFDNSECCTVSVKGHVLDLLAEATICFGKVLHGILRDCPSKALRDELIKGVFENTLDAMREEGEQE